MPSLWVLGPNTMTSVLLLFSIKKLLDIHDLMAARHASRGETGEGWETVAEFEGSMEK